MISSTSLLDRFRTVALTRLFDLLYHRLGFLHETAGRIAFGGAWDARRELVLPERICGVVLDIGCGEGRLLARHAETGCLGIEPSLTMARRAAERGVSVVCASAQALPLNDASVHHVVCTYPGPWIIDEPSWKEIERVAVSGATISVLLGGTAESNRMRAMLTWLAYGKRRDQDWSELPNLGTARLSGGYERVNDAWGEAIVWRGRRK